ncbi:MAG TPA: hypothetical protein VGN10_10060 [Pyrinomonadaceae bacterium]
MAVLKDTYFARPFRLIAVAESGMDFEELGSRNNSGDRALSGVRIVYCDIVVNVL